MHNNMNIAHSRPASPTDIVLKFVECGGEQACSGGVFNENKYSNCQYAEVQQTLSRLNHFFNKFYIQIFKKTILKPLTSWLLDV